jgi:endonuclease YncB( thermonuclease family)
VSRGAGCAAGAAMLALCFLLPAPVFAEEPEIVPPASRDVTPPGMTPGPAGAGPLVREAVPPPAPDPPRWHRFFLPVTTDAATFVSGGLTIKVAGVVPPSRSETCPEKDGATWPCGEVALGSLRRFLLGRAVECWFGPADTGPQITVACRVGKADIGLWLVSQGWAKPAADASGAYRQAADAARCGQRGLWRDGGRDRCPAD